MLGPTSPRIFLIAVTLSIAADGLPKSSLEPLYEMPSVTNSGILISETVNKKEFASDSVTFSSESEKWTLRGPVNVALSSDLWPSVAAVSKDEDLLPTIPSLSDSVDTSSVHPDSLILNPVGDPQQGLSSAEVVVIAICVSLFSLVIIIVSVAMTVLIRRQMRRKAYLRVKHASQTELAVHYVQNTPASVAARDAAMEQLFQSLASMNPDGHTDFEAGGYSSDDQCLSPMKSAASEPIGSKNQTHSRSLPSLKNLNAHEEALNCNLANFSFDVPNRMKGRSRSFTERAISGIDPLRNKAAVRSHSEKQKNRLAVVNLLTSGKHFEKKAHKSNRRSAPSFSRLAKFNILKSQPVKTKTANCSDLAPPPQVSSQPETDATGQDLVQSKRYSASLSDFELPTVSPIMQDISPMLISLHINSASANQDSNGTDKSDIHNSEIRIFRDVESLDHCSTKSNKSLEEVRDECQCHGSSNSINTSEKKGLEGMKMDHHSSVCHIETICKNGSVIKNLDKKKPTIS